MDIHRIGWSCEWLKEGSMLCVVFKKEDPVAFIWTHFKEHNIEYVGDFDMGSEIAWLGPSFVHRKYRGKGLQQLVILQGMASAPTNIKVFITSVNASNIPSLRSLEKIGFKVGMEVVCKTGVLVSKRIKVKALDKHSEKYLKIKG